MDLFLAYVLCFAFGLVFAIASAVASHLFGGHEHPGDFDAGHGDGIQGDHGPTLTPLSPTTLASFITAFGAFRMVFSRFEATRHPVVSISLSALGGVGSATVVVLLFRAIFSRMQSSSESLVGELTGREATVITPIAPEGVGEIAYVDRGVRYTAAARSDDGSHLPNGTAVTIRRIVASQFYVGRNR